MIYENYSTDGAICPHCQHMHYPHDDKYELFSESTDTWECDDCGKEFLVAVNVWHSWTTEKQEASHERT